MELHQLRARLALLDDMLSRIDARQPRVEQLKKTVYVLRALLANDQIPTAYGPNTAIARFSLQ